MSADPNQTAKFYIMDLIYKADRNFTSVAGFFWGGGGTGRLKTVKGSFLFLRILRIKNNMNLSPVRKYARLRFIKLREINQHRL